MEAMISFFKIPLVQSILWAIALIAATAVVARIASRALKHFLDRDSNPLPSSSIIVNIARGPVIDEAALVAALEAGKLGCAALDVFEHEPKVPEALIKSDQAVLLPHIGSATLETRQSMEDLMLENLAAYFDTGRVVTPVD